MLASDMMIYFPIWGWLIFVYLLLAFVTLLPTIRASRIKIRLNPGGASFDDSAFFSDNTKKQLSQHYSRIHGTLIFWKNKAEKYNQFNKYCFFWSTTNSVIIPVLIQFIDDQFLSKLLITIISTHLALIIAFHKSLKVENNYKAFRLGESEFYDLYRQLLDTPLKFGDNESEQVENYFLRVEQIRKTVRNIEISNFPIVDYNISLKD